MHSGERDYALLRPVGPELRGQGRLRRVCAFAAGASLLAALLVVAVSTTRPVVGSESAVSADLKPQQHICESALCTGPYLLRY